MKARIIAVANYKGGVGKTTIAYELAAALGAVLVDLEHAGGSATKRWGYEANGYKRSPIIDALERGPSGPAPRPKLKPSRPALLPGHRDLGASEIPYDLIADCLEAWATEWDYPYVVVDTHPGGGSPLLDGALCVADLVVVPVVFGVLEMDGVDEMLENFSDYRILLAPNAVPPFPPRRLFERLRAIAEERNVPVAPPISEHRWLRRRLRRAAVTLQEPAGRDVRAAATEYRRLAHAVEEACV